MNCAKHPETAAAAYCRTCGKALCETCKRDVHGVIYCEDCLATRVQAAVPPASVVPPASGPNPAIAGILSGFFPFGVGQAYNGQYARGFVYLVVFIGLIWAINHGGSSDVIFGLLLAAFYFWQIVDAVRSARFLQMGMAAPDPFGVDRLFGGSGVPTPRASAAPAGAAPGMPAYPSGATGLPVTGAGEPECCETRSRVPLGAVLLIGIGLLLLMGNIGLLRWHWAGEFWPAILIIIGGWLLATRWEEISAGSPRGRRMLMGPAILLVVGITFLLDNVGTVPFHRTWPLILVVIGVVLLWQRSGPASLPPGPPVGLSSGEQPQPDASVEQNQER